MINYQKLTVIHRRLIKLHLTGTEYACLLYLADQQYGYLVNGNLKDGDYASYSHIAKSTGFHRQGVINTINKLVNMGILIKSEGNKYGNHYSFNEGYFGIESDPNEYRIG